MFEDRTYENILREMLNRVPDDIDKREGSVIYDALAPTAYSIADLYFQLRNFIDLVLPDTALDEFLDRWISAFGTTRKTAEAAVRKMTTSDAVDIGTRWEIGGLVYFVRSALTETEYEVVCETAGVVGNQYAGEMQPISPVVGVTATLGDIITAGIDKEENEPLRSRFYIRVRRPATSGNAYQYQQWALEVPGVGAAKVFPLDNGPGTVGVMVADSDMQISPGLPEKVAEYIETVRPVGATVSVYSPAALSIDVSANVLLDGSKSLQEVKEAYESALREYLDGLVFTAYRASYAKLGSLLLDIPGIEDFDTFLLNGNTGNVTIGAKQIPVIGKVTLAEVSELGSD